MTTLAKPYFTRFDDAFSIHLSRTYNLSLLLGRDRLSFCFNRHDDNSLIGIESYNLGVSEPQSSSLNETLEWCRELKLLFEDLESLKKPFRQVHIAVECHKSTLIPAELFSEGNQEEFLSFNQPHEEFEICRHETIPNLGAEIIYAMPSCIISELQAVFPEAEIVNASGQIIENLLKLPKEASADGILYANVRGAWVELICIEQGKLRFFNRFRYRTREDLAYYVIFVMEQLGLNPDTISLVLMGNIERQSGRFELLYRYIRNIRFMEKPLNKAGKALAADIPVSVFYNLLSFAKCV
jgi:hypothetical protein